MAQATETFALGGTQVTTVVEIDLNTVWLISGDFAGTIPSGQTGFINGDVNLTGDLIVEGLLTGVDAFTLTGNGFQILVQNGGQLNLQGVQKSGWVNWGVTPTGWLIGDRLGTAPTAAGVYVPSTSVWSGGWGTRPVNSPTVTLPNGIQVEAEVANLSRSIILKNLRRIHFHDGAGVQTLRHLAIVDSGVTGALTQYPLHFHLCGETVRGSLVEGVVVEGGKNHAFVPHGSHGITFRDVVAYRTTDFAFWWDFPPATGNTVNDSNDIIYQHALGMDVRPQVGDPGYRLAAFVITAGVGCKVTDSVMTCVQGSVDASGFNWPEKSVSSFWLFEDNVSHNNKIDGIFTWQNGGPLHVIDRFVAYRNGGAGIDHGAYVNWYHYKNCVLMGNAEAAFKLHARDSVQLHDIVADGPLRLMKQQNNASTFCVVRRCSFTLMDYQESGANKFSKIRYEDGGEIPAEFAMAFANPASIAEIREGGVLMHRWTQGAWT